MSGRVLSGSASTTFHAHVSLDRRPGFGVRPAVHAPIVLRNRLPYAVEYRLRYAERRVSGLDRMARSVRRSAGDLPFFPFRARPRLRRPNARHAR